MNLIAKHSDTKSNYHNLVDCQESSDGQQWLSCDGVATVPEGRVFDDDLRHQICFDASPGVNCDIDNISIESLGGPTDSIIVEDSVKGKCRRSRDEEHGTTRCTWSTCELLIEMGVRG